MRCEFLVVDFNRDGLPDLAGSTSDGNIGVLVSDGQGRFSVNQGAGSGLSGVTALLTADFDGDGKLDLAVNRVPFVLFGSTAQ